MTRRRAALRGLSAVAALLLLVVACGRYGPPQRSSPSARAAEVRAERAEFDLAVPPDSEEEVDEELEQ